MKKLLCVLLALLLTGCSTSTVDLPSGHYRLVTNDLTAEFDVE